MGPEAKSDKNHWPKAKNTYTISHTQKQQHKTHNSSLQIKHRHAGIPGICIRVIHSPFPNLVETLSPHR